MPNHISLLSSPSSSLQSCNLSLGRYNSSSQSLQGESLADVDDEPLNLLRGGSNSIGGVDTIGAIGKGEYINTLRLLRGGDPSDGCDVSDEDDMRDLLQDGPKYRYDGAYDEDSDIDDDEYSDDEPDGLHEPSVNQQPSRQMETWCLGSGNGGLSVVIRGQDGGDGMAR
ncbi:hypothetical protein Tco_1449209 [Tanacetum coccineum]